MKKHILFLGACALFATSFTACKKDNTDGPKGGMITINVDNVAGEADLKMDGTLYRNQNGDPFSVSKFNYYISNIAFHGENGLHYNVKDEYYLLEEEKPGSLQLNIPNIPSGKYNSITFTIGVDSIRNVSGAQSGALDPANGMFWSWTTGYIMLKFEGNSSVSTQADGMLMFHAGGFSGENNVVKTVDLDLPSVISVNGNNNKINMKADVLKLFGGNSTISFADLSVIHMPGANAKKLADNYQNMFSISYSGL